MKKKTFLFFVALVSFSLSAQEILQDEEVVLKSNIQKKAVSELIDNTIVYLVEPVNNEQKANEIALPQKKAAEDVQHSASNKTSENKNEQKKLPSVQPKVEKEVIAEKKSENTIAESKTENESESKEITPSRTISAKQNQHISISFDGTKWTYLGEEGENKITTYDGTASKEKSTEFYFFAKNAGSTLLHFYKNDVIGKKYIDDYIALEVEGSSNAQENNSQKTSDKQEQNDEQLSESKAENESESDKTTLKTISQGEKGSYKEAPDPSSFKIESRETQPETPSETDAVLEKAQEAYNAGNFSEAKSLLDTFFGSAITNLDHGLFLQGQILEAYSSVQNIRGALSSYKNLLLNYPNSTYAAEAEKRAIYLERFYFNIY